MAHYQVQEDIDSGLAKYPPPQPQSIHWPPQLSEGPVVFVRTVIVDKAWTSQLIKRGTKAKCIAIRRTDATVSNLEAVVELPFGQVVTVDSTSLRIYHEAF